MCVGKTLSDITGIVQYQFVYLTFRLPRLLTIHAIGLDFTTSSLLLLLQSCRHLALLCHPQR